MMLAHKIRFYPNKEQEEALIRACGCKRFAYNWGLEKWKEMYSAWKADNTLPKPNAMLIKKEFNRIKETEFPWIYESPKDANQQAFANLKTAFNKFFKKEGKYPKFKKKRDKDSFYISNDKFSINQNILKLPIIGEVRLAEELRFMGKIMSGTVSRTADQWFVSIQVETDLVVEKCDKNTTPVGVDFGIKTFATLSTGEKIESPNPLRKQEKMLKRLSRSHSRKKFIKDANGFKKESNNKKKIRIKLARKYQRISNIRNDFLHKFTTKLCRENQTVVLEDLNIKGLMKGNLAKSIADVSWYEAKRQIFYKSNIYDTVVIVADRFYPSSKICSGCGNKKNDLTLSDRTYNCEVCKMNIDRDLNAALNLSRLGLSRIDACGHLASGSSDNDELSQVDETRTTQAYTC